MHSGDASGHMLPRPALVDGDRCMMAESQPYLTPFCVLGFDVVRSEVMRSIIHIRQGLQGPTSFFLNRRKCL
jgi:hypothetical protein